MHQSYSTESPAAAPTSTARVSSGAYAGHPVLDPIEQELVAP